MRIEAAKYEGGCLLLKTADTAARRFVYGFNAGEYEIVKAKKRRSLDANAYMWELVGKLSAKIGLPPEEIYRAAIRDVGDNYEVMPVRNDALDRWKEIWASKGTGWVCEEIGASKLAGYTNVRNFYGSSVYETKQMSRLIDIIVQDCKAQGIETLTPLELARMTEEWK